MFNFCNLYSGSNGNSTFIQTENTKILVDAGESAKKIVNALSIYNVDISTIDAIIVTHEHTDHTKSIATLSNKYNIPIYANKKTWNAMPEQSKKIQDDYKKYFVTNDIFEIKDIKIYPFKIPHDAAEPCGFNIYNSNTKISIATDFGHITDNILENLEKSKFALIEANYDPNILQCSRYPYSLKQRIAGPNGHLSNNESGNLISMLMKTGLSSVILGHLSKENNFPELAYKTVVEQLINNKYDESSIHIEVAKRDTPGKLIEIA